MRVVEAGVYSVPHALQAGPTECGLPQGRPHAADRDPAHGCAPPPAPSKLRSLGEGFV